MTKNTTNLRVEGMDCANCAASITRFLQQRGLRDVFVNFQTKEVRYRPDAAALSEPEVRAGIEKLGFRVVGTDAAREPSESVAPDPAAPDPAARRLWICVAFTLPLLLGHLLMMFGLAPAWLTNGWAQLALAAPVYLVGGLHFGRSARAGLRAGYLNMDVLIFLGATAAFIYSLVGLYWGDPRYYFFETAATIITLVLVGNWLEGRAVARTTTAVTALGELRAETAVRINPDGSGQSVAAATIRPGELIRVNTGDRIPLDGTVTAGRGTADESLLTGESLGVEKEIGDSVIGGSTLAAGQLTVSVTAPQSDGTLARMIELVKTAQADKPALQRLADRASAVFVPVVIGLSVLTILLGWSTGYASPTQALMNAIAVLLISCPCAMGLATPTAVMVGVGRLARNGIMIKGGSAVESLAGVRRMVFDKTGTLTTGRFRVEKLDVLGGDPATVLGLLLFAERGSSHPVARSIVGYLEERGVAVPAGMTDRYQVREISGLGVELVDISTSEVAMSVGSFRILASDDQHLAERGEVFLVDAAGRTLAIINLADDLKPGAAAALAELADLGIETHLLSGDRQARTAAIADRLNVSRFAAEQRPAEKLSYVSHLSEQAPTAMVGDGINDAAALARADLGISLNGASAAAVDAARIVLLKDNLSALPAAVRLSRLTLRTIRESLFWAFSYNVVAIPLAALGYLNPMWAALFMAFSDVVVIGNAIRLKHRKYPRS